MRQAILAIEDNRFSRAWSDVGRQLGRPSAILCVSAHWQTNGVMVTAIRHVHWRNGVWNSNGGYEFNGVILATLASLVETGPGRWSVDEVYEWLNR